MQVIPLQAIPSQSLKVVLGGQNCQIAVYQKPQGLFVDIVADSVAQVDAVIARDLVPLNCRGSYLGFVGNLIFADMQGSSDPDYTGLGVRFMLLYLTADEYAQL